MQKEHHQKPLVPHSRQEEFKKGVWWQLSEEGLLIKNEKVKNLKVNMNWTLTDFSTVWTGAEWGHSPRAA